MANWSEKLNQVTHSAINKGKGMAEVAKLNMEIASLNQDLKAIHTVVGSYVLENGLLAEDSAVAEWAAKADAIKANIAENTERIQTLKNINVCPKCGAELPRTSKFCDQCGTAIVTAAPAEEETVDVDADEPKECEECTADDSADTKDATVDSTDTEDSVIDSTDTGDSVVDSTHAEDVFWTETGTEENTVKEAGLNTENENNSAF